METGTMGTPIRRLWEKLETDADWGEGVRGGRNEKLGE
jgi:hypothetical protein